MNKIVLIIVCIFALSSCKVEKKHPPQITPGHQTETQVFQHLDSIPEGENGEELKLLQETIVKNLFVVDNHMQFRLTKEEFVSLGLPENYYDRLMQDLKDVNNMVDSSGLKNMDTILKESYRDLYELFGQPNTNY